MITSVVDLSTGEQTLWGLDPASAVVAAHAQSLGDWNTWGYDRYRSAVVAVSGRIESVRCGRFAAAYPGGPT